MIPSVVAKKCGVELVIVIVIAVQCAREAGF